MLSRTLCVVFAATALLFAAGCNNDDDSGSASDGGTVKSSSPSSETATPIKHLVVIYDENVSFDHYFGTYPEAKNVSGVPQFTAAADTPAVNNYVQKNQNGTGYVDIPALTESNPNYTNPANQHVTSNGKTIDDRTNPFRLARSQALTADQDHNYEPEQMAFDDGAMDLFPKSVGRGGPPPNVQQATATQDRGLTMGYYDGNTVTALWNYAQRYAMSDNFYGTTFGPSTPGAINLASGQTNGVIAMSEPNNTYGYVPDGNGGKTLIGDPDPMGDKCSSALTFRMGGKNIGDLLNAAGVSWGWFQGGFDLSVVNPDGSTGCDRAHMTRVISTGEDSNSAVQKNDYIPHHEPFQYYASTANPDHDRPSSVASIGHTDEISASGQATTTKDPANHQYDVHDFFDAVKAGNFPAVAFLKAPGYENGHAGYSDPIDEQYWLVKVINFIEQQPQWQHTAIIIAYDDSDGWYDHRYSPNVNPSDTNEDALNGANTCNQGGQGSQPRSQPLDGIDGKPAEGRCGHGPRLPFLLISPWAKKNFVSDQVIDQTSIIRFIEDNWLHGQRIGDGSFDQIAGSIDNMFDFSGKTPANAKILLLDQSTGEPTSTGQSS